MWVTESRYCCTFVRVHRQLLKQIMRSVPMAAYREVYVTSERFDCEGFTALEREKASEAQKKDDSGD
jgi:hypothetical protein